MEVWTNPAHDFEIVEVFYVECAGEYAWIAITLAGAVCGMVLAGMKRSIAILGSLCIDVVSLADWLSRGRWSFF